MSIEIKLQDIDNIGRGKIFVDGKDLSDHVCGVKVDSFVGRPTQVTLTLNDCVIVELTAMADVTRRYKKFGEESIDSAMLREQIRKRIE